MDIPFTARQVTTFDDGSEESEQVTGVHNSISGTQFIVDIQQERPLSDCDVPITGRTAGALPHPLPLHRMPS